MTPEALAIIWACVKAHSIRVVREIPLPANDSSFVRPTLLRFDVNAPISDTSFGVKAVETIFKKIPEMFDDD